MKKHLVVLTGAGISAESGIRTFRDSNGLWEEYRVEDVATPEGWARDPQLVTDFYNQRRQQLLSTQPCAAHRLLAELEQQYDVDIITQNVDDLHERAGSSRVLHLHGELAKVTSSLAPNDPEQIRVLQPEEYEVKIGDKAKDGSPLRPYIVWFGEAVPNIEPAIDLTMQADIFLVVGTSLNVYPAAGLLHYTRVGTPIYLIDPNDVQVPGNVSVTHIQQGASAGVQELMNKYLFNK
ncbi:MAG: NAD-dependent deacylase [Paludibacteraceae bacterium]|nr:NAD-dependent deacylase [Paludibacteraceae bacterium]